MDTPAHPAPRLSREQRGRLLEGAGWAFAVFFVLMVARFSVNLMIEDDWRFFEQAATIASAPWSRAGDLFVRYNHSIVAFLRLLYMACLEWFGGDTRFLVGINVACLAVAFLGFRSVLKGGVADPLWRGALILYAALVCFSFSAWYLVLTGWGIQWMIMPCLLGIALVADRRNLPFGVTLALFFALALVGSLTMADGLALWIVLPLLLGRRFGWSWAGAAIWAAGAAASVALEFQQGTPESVEGHPPRLLENAGHPLALLKFFCVLSGGMAGQIHASVALGAVLGAVLILGFLGCLALYLRHRRALPELERARPWLVVGLFYLLATALISGGRFQYGIARALSKHYVTLSLGLSLAVVVLVVLLVVLAPPRLRAAPEFRWLRAGLVPAALLAVVFYLAAVPPSLERFLRDWEFRQAVLGQYALNDIVVEEERISDETPEWSSRQRMESLGLLTLLPRPEIEARIARAREALRQGRAAGRTTVARAVLPGELRIDGALEVPRGGAPFWGVLVGVRLGDGEWEYRFRRVLRSISETARRHDGRWSTVWSVGMPLPPGPVPPAEVEVYAVSGGAALEPLATGEEGR